MPGDYPRVLRALAFMGQKLNVTDALVINSLNNNNNNVFIFRGLHIKYNLLI